MRWQDVELVRLNSYSSYKLKPIGARRLVAQLTFAQTKKDPPWDDLSHRHHRMQLVEIYRLTIEKKNRPPRPRPPAGGPCVPKQNHCKLPFLQLRGRPPSPPQAPPEALHHRRRRQKSRVQRRSCHFCRRRSCRGGPRGMAAGRGRQRAGRAGGWADRAKGGLGRPAGPAAGEQGPPATSSSRGAPGPGLPAPWTCRAPGPAPPR